MPNSSLPSFFQDAIDSNPTPSTQWGNSTEVGRRFFATPESSNPGEEEKNFGEFLQSLPSMVNTNQFSQAQKRFPESTNLEDRRDTRDPLGSLLQEIDAGHGPQHITPTGKTLGDVLFGENRYITWPEQAIRNIISAAKLPGEVHQGKVDMNSQEGIEKATDLALNTMLGGLGGVGKAGAKEVGKSIIGPFGEKYFSALSAEGRMSKSGTTHPGFEFQIIDKETGKIATGSPATSKNMTRANTQANLLNEYHNTDRFQAVFKPTEKLTKSEKASLEKHGLLDDYLELKAEIKRGGPRVESNVVLGSGPIIKGPGEKIITDETNMVRLNKAANTNKELDPSQGKDPFQLPGGDKNAAEFWAQLKALEKKWKKEAFEEKFKIVPKDEGPKK